LAMASEQAREISAFVRSRLDLEVNYGTCVIHSLKITPSGAAEQRSIIVDREG